MFECEGVLLCAYARLIFLSVLACEREWVCLHTYVCAWVFVPGCAVTHACWHVSELAHAQECP